MRRKDKEIVERSEMESILEQGVVCRVAFAHENTPYIVPVNYGYRENTIYFHSAPAGRKIDMLRANNLVCFEIDVDVEIVKSPSACKWGMNYRCVIGYGKAQLIEDPLQKGRALDIIMSHYSDEAFEYSPEKLGKVAVVKIAITEMTAKKSGY